MTSNKSQRDAAFPRPESPKGDWVLEDLNCAQRGLTKRECAAIIAMQGVLVNSWVETVDAANSIDKAAALMAFAAVKVADALFEALEEP